MKKMLRKMLLLLIIAFMLTGCATVQKIFPPNPHPELNREFNWRTDEPGMYPY